MGNRFSIKSEINDLGNKIVYDSNKVYLDIAIIENNLQNVKKFIDNGADVNAKKKNKNTPLHKAANYGHTEIAKFLIENGADVNAQGQFGQTSLHVAATNCYTETVELLIKNGASINIQNDDYDTSLELILENENLRNNKQIRSALETKFYQDFETEIKEDVEKLLVLQQTRNIIGFEDFKKNILIHMEDYQNAKKKLSLNLNWIELQIDKAKIKTFIHEAFLLKQQNQTQIEVSNLKEEIKPTSNEITQAEIEKLGARPKGSRIVQKQIETEIGCKPYKENQSKKDDNYDKDGASGFGKSSWNITQQTTTASTIKSNTSGVSSFENQKTKEFQDKQNQLNIEEQYHKTLQELGQMEVEKENKLQKLAQIQSSNCLHAKDEIKEEIKPQTYEIEKLSKWDDNFESFLQEVSTHELEELVNQKNKQTKQQVAFNC